MLCNRNLFIDSLDNGHLSSALKRYEDSREYRITILEYADNVIVFADSYEEMHK